MRAIVAGLSFALLAATASSDVTVDVASLSKPEQASQSMPVLAKTLLQTNIPDAATRIQLQLVAGDRAGADALMRRLGVFQAIRLETALADKDPFGSWSDARETFKGRTALSPNEAVRLIVAYAPETSAAQWLVQRDRNRRFNVQRVSIPTPDGVTLAALVVRSRGATGRLPAALEFTIYAQPDEDARRAEYAAARGYAAVTAFSRGKAWGSGRIVPYEFDGRDADRVISWIAKQAWSDAKVGMYGGSYDGFTQWAAAKYANPALKTIVPYVANNPGNGLPMENNIFLLVNYAWVYFVTDNRYLDAPAYASPAGRTLNDRWYASGASYRDAARFFGRPNPWLQKWLDHPAFDTYWQSMVPYKGDFARIRIPVLTVSGYYDDGQGSALNFLKDHLR